MSDEKLADLYLIGTGIRDLQQLTREARDILQRCRKIFHLTSSHQGLVDLGPEVINNAGEYWTGEPVRQVYQRITEKVMASLN